MRSVLSTWPVRVTVVAQWREGLLWVRTEGEASWPPYAEVSLDVGPLHFEMIACWTGG